MNDRALNSLAPDPRVTIEAAAELTGTDAATIRRWIDEGTLTHERRGDMGVVRLHEVRMLASRRRTDERHALRVRLAAATSRAEEPSPDPLDPPVARPESFENASRHAARPGVGTPLAGGLAPPGVAEGWTYEPPRPPKRSFAAAIQMIAALAIAAAAVGALQVMCDGASRC